MAGYCWCCGRMSPALYYAMCVACVVIAGDKLRVSRETQQVEHCWLN
jgi:hypothetical protein